MIERIFSAFAASCILTLLLIPLVTALAKKMKLRQTVLEYVDNHAMKSGTPTMGGVAFVASTAIISPAFMYGDKSLALICLAVTGGYAVVGFLDDFIKVWYKQNKGLSPWQKIVFQIIIAGCVSLYAYFSPFIGDKQYIPISYKTFNMGIFAIPFYVVVFLAGSNSVNLIDGLDGLAANVTKNYLICFTVLMFVAINVVGVTFATETENVNLLIFSCALAGSLIGYDCYNCYPAKIFMGDTGSLALGGAIAGLSIVTGSTLVLPLLGIMYVITALSVIIQVLHYKCKKKRVFLMAPIHHHFERKGVHENRIVSIYSMITLLVGCAMIIAVLAVN